MSVQAHKIVKHPIITEESQIQTSKGNQYTFAVAPGANKREIRDAIESIFPDVKVTRVNTMNYQGKMRRQFTARGRHSGRKASWKKAVVTLREGDSIDLI